MPGLLRSSPCVASWQSTASALSRKFFLTLAHLDHPRSWVLWAEVRGGEVSYQWGCCVDTGGR